jgi:ATP-dependent Lon protease
MLRFLSYNTGAMTEKPPELKPEDEPKETREHESEVPEQLPILPLRDSVVFPQSLVPLTVGRDGSLRAVEEAMARGNWLGVLLQTDPGTEVPGPDDLYRVGTACRIVRVLRYPNQTIMVLVQGIARFRVMDYLQQEPYLLAKIEILRPEIEEDVELEAIIKNLTSRFHKLAMLSPNLSAEVFEGIQRIRDPDHLADAVAAQLDLESEEKQELLEEIDAKRRLLLLTRLLEREIEFLELGTKIESEVKGELERGMRERYLREKLEAIRRELGEEENPELGELHERIHAAKMPPEIEKEAMRELERLAQMHPSSAEYTVARTYLGWLVELPWSKRTRDRLDIERAGRILDEDHYDLEKVKERILEHLAVLQLQGAQKRRKRKLRGPILCFVGPPGVGKTSLGQSIARALGRRFVRISLGGVRDEAEIRGHRRTYIGALPGRIIQGLRRAGTKNPVFMLDEIDKLGADFRGDPAAALLEVLDPEQNSKFEDHYLGVPFDLSETLFILTANILDTIPPALLDRMEVLEIPGYSDEEKLQIAQRYLIPRQLVEHGFPDGSVVFEDAAVMKIIREYTREAGVRNLEREIASVLRKIAVCILKEKCTPSGGDPQVITPKEIAEFLGPPKYFYELAERMDRSGVAVGLVVTRVGGDIVFIEATKMRGKGNLILTGSLGDVMKESAQAALSYVRSQAEHLGIYPETFEKNDIHVHVPAGAIPKDGPSAGVTIASALASLLTDMPLLPELAMTGEITLRGKVLPVGGVREKVLAAHRAGVTTVILPKRNEADVTDAPENVRDVLRFHFVDTVEEVFERALPKALQHAELSSSAAPAGE